MTIHFYLNDENETQVTSFYDLQSNPFSIGDIIHLEVDELYPAEYNKYKEEVRIKMIEDSERLSEKFHRKTVKLVREFKQARFALIKESALTIEYHCELVTIEAEKVQVSDTTKAD